jgi:hypothetical protein
MIREVNRARLTRDAALLLSKGIALLVRHARDRGSRVGATIAFVRGRDASQR